MDGLQIANEHPVDPAVLQAIFQGAVVGIATVALDGRWLNFNRKFCDILGYPAQELAGLTSAEITHPDDQAEDIAGMKQCLAGNADGFKSDKRYIRKDGGEVWAELSMSAIRDGQGQVLYFIATLVDITDRLHLARENQISRLTTKIGSRFDFRLNDIVEDICATAMSLTRSPFGLCSYKDPSTGRYVTVNKTADDVDADTYREAANILTSRQFWPVLLSSPVVVNTDTGPALPGVELSVLPVARLLSAAAYVASESTGFVAVADGANAYSDHHEDTVSSLAAVMALASERLNAYMHMSQQSAQLDLAVKEMVSLVTTVAELRDRYTAGHENRVAQLASETARVMGLDPGQVDGVYYAALLHDIGKIALPLDILSKPGRLLEEEFRLVQRHSAIGRDILENAHLPWPCATVAGQHHERLDGSGYPDGLAGDDITIESRIVGVCDVVEAMAS
ncbi:MAG: PAS domain S-box protein, partial [Nitrospinaceae bacterium]|nr:PAS domain S-box protein [Nitrospinaceae bacterium]